MSEKGIILIVDNNENNRAVFKTNLEMQGFAVYFTENNIQAIQKARDILPDIILLNIMTSCMENCRILEHIKEDTNLFDIPIMTLAVKSMPDNVINTIRASADELLIKPFDVDTFFKKINHLINIKQNQKVVKLNPNKKKKQLNLFEIKFKLQTRKAVIFQKKIESALHNTKDI